MKDFLKILFVLVVVVVAFIGGRNYGETSILESKDYKETKSQISDNARSDEELRLVKEKLQNLLDSADLKKADEVYGKMMTLFLVDLGLRLSEQQQKDLDVGKQQLVMCSTSSESASASKDKETIESTPVEKSKIQTEVDKAPRFSKLNAGRFKSTEWTLVNSPRTEDILINLEKIKLTNMDAFLMNSPETKFSDLQKYYGTFRGRIAAVDGSNYGSLVISVGPNPEKANNVSGEVKLYREGKAESTQNFHGETWGSTPTGYQAQIVKMGQRYLQIYKIENADKIAGNFYERLPNGTTKLIGSFVLSRTDRI